ncbi:MAG: response regulator transcription factor [Hymenobacteraceae bacterium]|nr:response regulator transcription factor [Hymenobacteraceae bacterium]MDX5395199.1 response regulator transcription factor [Hymenobacteraceae bacterium]MDX5443462.1 response regulator transcription factor [Hymenobacteraceae bacterium]MDX5511237.1 response regulator transcription factor [Hymenobacteraceae bacterium]
MARILLVEDDENLGYLVQDSLEAKGFSVELCTDGAAGLRAYKEQAFDLCVLDVMLPVLDGFSVAKEIRKGNSDIPLLFLTAKARQEDRIYGLTLGADDYLSKPFSIEELYLRIKSILKRVQPKQEPEKQTNEVIKFGTTTLDYPNLQLTVKDQPQTLTQKEADLILLLSQHQNNIVKRDTILKSIWEDNGYFVARSMDVFISRVRKLLKPDEQLKITTVHGVGYKLEVVG